MRMKNPCHPGEILREESLKHLGLTVTKAAKVLGVSRQALNNVVNCKAAVSAEMALRLEKAFGGTAEFWLRLQSQYDLAQVLMRGDRIKVKRFARAAKHSAA